MAKLLLARLWSRRKVTALCLGMARKTALERQSLFNTKRLIFNEQLAKIGAQCFCMRA
jgi:malate/lactate dehydrogenase